jgi:hypothetical protein
MATKKNPATSEEGFSFDAGKALPVLMAMEEGMSLRAACEHFDLAPSTFLRWVDGDEELAEQYARARERLLDAKAEELEEIGERAAAARTGVEVAGLRLLSDNRKWLLSKLAPKKYGDKVIQEHTGPNGGPLQALLGRMGRSSLPVVKDLQE